MEKPQIKKKIKNSGWNSVADQTQEKMQNVIFSSVLKIDSKPLTELKKKYKVNTSKQLGHGFASVVYQGINIQNLQKVCIKIIDYLALGGKQKIYLLKQQIHYLKEFQCQNIVKLYDVYQSPQFCYLAMELCSGGDLFRYCMLEKQQLSEITVNQFVKGICIGLRMLKDKKLIHRDLKTQNIFIGQNNEVKIGDLGFCTPVQKQDKLNVGSPIYMSPQIFSQQKYSYSSDIYGLGVIWYQLLNKASPWKARTQQQLIQQKNINQINFKRTNITQQTMQMIIKCLNVDPQKRPQVNQIGRYLEQYIYKYNLNKKTMENPQN